MKRRLLLGFTAAALALGLAPQAQAAAILLNPGFNTNTLAANDDGSTGLVNVGFTFNLFGLTQNNLYVNNNGNVTFTGALSTFTPFPIVTTGLPMIAPFFADVDTRAAGDLVHYGTDTVNGHAAFGVNWINVDYFAASTTHTNRDSFQLVMIDRSDLGAGDFDFMFNYNLIQWEAGTASGSSNEGCGGSPARAGYSNGTVGVELPGSGVAGAFIDSGTCAGVEAIGSNALIRNSLNSNVPGQYIFNVRNGEVVVTPVGPTPVPEPASLTLLGTGIAAVLRNRLRRKSNA